MGVECIESERLVLQPVTYDLVKSIIDGNTCLVEKIGFKNIHGWPNEDTLEILPIIAERMKNYKEITGFDPWIIAHKGTMSIVGDAGFKGPPDEEGCVEIGYGLMEEERGKGYCTEAVQALAKWAFSQGTVKLIKADCLLDNYASIRILQKCKFKELRKDEELIYWELDSNL